MSTNFPYIISPNTKMVELSRVIEKIKDAFGSKLDIIKQRLQTEYGVDDPDRFFQIANKSIQSVDPTKRWLLWPRHPIPTLMLIVLLGLAIKLDAGIAVIKYGTDNFINYRGGNRANDKPARLNAEAKKAVTLYLMYYGEHPTVYGVGHDEEGYSMEELRFKRSGLTQFLRDYRRMSGRDLHKRIIDIYNYTLNTPEEDGKILDVHRNVIRIICEYYEMSYAEIDLDRIFSELARQQILHNRDKQREYNIWGYRKIEEYRGCWDDGFYDTRRHDPILTDPDRRKRIIEETLEAMIERCRLGRVRPTAENYYYPYLAAIQHMGVILLEDMVEYSTGGVYRPGDRASRCLYEDLGKPFMIREEWPNLRVGKNSADSIAVWRHMYLPTDPPHIDPETTIGDYQIGIPRHIRYFD